MFPDFPTFSRTWIFFLPRLSLLWSALFYSSLLSASSHLCLSSVHTVGSLTSKLPSVINYTSSTAQGGGGSFKNRKPIGKVGCCESRMAERSHWWMERRLMSPLFLSLSLTTYLPTYLSIYLSTCLSASLKTKLFCETSSFFEVDNIKTKQFCKTSSFLKLTTSKTKQFCETSSFFQVDNITNEAILRDFFNFSTWQHQKQSNSARLPSKMESWVQS